MNADKKPSSRRLHPRELFVAGLTPFELSSSPASQLSEIVEPHEDLTEDGDVLGKSATEVCLIGLVAHDEAFCKHQFTALINICPDLLRAFDNTPIKGSRA